MSDYKDKEFKIEPIVPPPSPPGLTPPPYEGAPMPDGPDHNVGNPVDHLHYPAQTQVELLQEAERQLDEAAKRGQEEKAKREAFLKDMESLAEDPGIPGKLTGRDEDTVLEDFMADARERGLSEGEALRELIGDHENKKPAVASRRDEGKVSMHYIKLFPKAAAALALVCMEGEKKYAYKNFLLGGKPDREYQDSFARHEAKLYAGEPHDDETGCHHLAHMLWNIMAWIELNVDWADLHKDPLKLRGLESLVWPAKDPLMPEKTYKDENSGFGLPRMYP